MIPVLSAQQARAVDEATQQNTPIASIDLMERAAARCVDRLLARYGADRHFLVLAGMGNNGGDGLAIARLLREAGRCVEAVVVAHRSEATPDLLVNRERAVASGLSVTELREGEEMPALVPNEVVIDALLGTGLARPLEGLLRRVVQAVNDRRSEVVAIDMPTGLFAEDNSGNDPAAIIRATHTLSFEVPKLAFLLPENAPYVGRWELLPIGSDRQASQAQHTHFHVIQAPDMAGLIPQRPRFGHKGTFGHALLISGSAGRMGAALLAGEGSLASGAGLITVHVPADLQPVMHAVLPPVMVSANPDPALVSDLPKLDGYSAIGIGPGIGTADTTARLLKRLIQEAAGPLVLDADAINLLGANPTWLAFLPATSILTPHPKEFDRLAGPSASGHERLMKARDLAQRRHLIIVLKGAFTATCVPSGRVYFNPTGNPGMAKGGSGDVLTGLITGLLAQGLAPEPAALLGVYLHGMAGDLAAEQLGMAGMTSSDLARHLPQAWKRLAGDQNRSSTGPLP
ncbi:MAG: NAD(P)H-hydrate dehydratase [Flavobacteriales bacterium]